MKPSSSGSSSKYRAHAPSDIPSTSRSRGSSSRHKGDSRDPQLSSWSPASTPATTPDYSLYDSRSLTHVRHEQHPYSSSHSHPPSHGAHSHHHPSSYSSTPSQYSQAYPAPLAIAQHAHSPYPNYENHPVPSPHSQQHHQSYPTPQSLTQHSSAHSHQLSHSHQASHTSELSQYSLSHYQPPSKPRFRIEQEGHNILVLPPGEAPPEADSPPPSPPLEPISPPPQWPPPHCRDELSPEEAKELISEGAPRFQGELREISNGPRGHYDFFAFAGDEWDEEDQTDTAPFQSDSFNDMSSAPEGRQTDALEQPAMAHAFGAYPGTLTLAYFVSGFGSTFRGSEVAARGKVRKLTMLYVLDRLRTLQVTGIEEEPIDLHHHLYEYLLHDVHKYDYSQTKFSLETQIGDLVAALCRPSWVDFSFPENQTVAQFLTDSDPTVANSFFHQLLLSIELYLRIKVRQSAGSKSQGDIPDKVRWDLMLAQRWLENVEIEAPKKVKDSKGRHGREQKSSVGFKFPNKKNQVEALRNFAWTLKWPNMHEVEYSLSEEEDPNELLEDRSMNCMSWFTGLLLPGKSMPWILMNALIDCDLETPEEFHDLQQTVSNVGFQYRGHTYWSWECIVGKVLGAASGVNQIAGWIGPCSASADLDRSEMARINQAPSKMNRITSSDVRNMAENSDPLGAYQSTYPVNDYILVVPNHEQPVDSIRIERLNFSPAACNPKGIHKRGLVDENGELLNKKPVIIFDASITFAITVEHRARSWKVSLRHDTSFIAAYPCQKGPHALFCEYQFRRVKVDKLVDIQNWGSSGADEESEEESSSNNEVEEVLIVEAFGVPDNEVFARAWCSFWGLPAITADIKKTCLACAVREAYAALVSVVILTNRGAIDEEVEEVDRLMENL